jgi:hypothetical protein
MSLFLPIVRVAFECGAHAGLVTLKHVTARADAGLRLELAVLGRHDRHVIVADDVREVGVALLHREDHRVLTVRLDLLDRLEDGLGRGLRLLAEMVVDRGHHVPGVQGLAVMELNPLTQLESPLNGVVRGLPALRELGDEFVGVAYLREVIAQAVPDELHVAVGKGRRIKGVGGRAVPDSDAEAAAFLRRCGDRCSTKQHRRYCRYRSQSRGTRQKLSARDLSSR